jgi:protein transport protein SEC13
LTDTTALSGASAGYVSNKHTATTAADIAQAHPKFGTLLASSSYDGQVHVWRESPGQTPSQPAVWSQVFTSRIHSASVNMVAWAPPEAGCTLACASSDGHVSVIEFRDSQWTETNFLAHGVGVNAVSWAPSGVPGATMRKNGGAAQQQTTPVRRFVTGGSDNQVKLWEFDTQQGKYENVGTLPGGHSDWVRDVAWSPTLLTKSYIASASQDKTVRIWTSVNPSDPSSWTLSKTLTLDAVLWRVSWSLSGNILAVSGGDNKVTLWKEDLKGEWKMVKEVTE